MDKVLSLLISEASSPWAIGSLSPQSPKVRPSSDADSSVSTPNRFHQFL